MEKIEKLRVIGIEVRTTNENQQSAKDIPLLWQRFFEENISTLIEHKQNDNLYCLYTAYEDDFTKPYTTILGYAVSTLDTIPDGLTGVEIPAGRYRKHSTQGDIHQGLVIKEWEKIWRSDLDRAYTVDFEVYTFTPNIEETTVDIFIAIK